MNASCPGDNVLPFCQRVVVIDQRLHYDLTLPWFGPLIAPIVGRRARRLEARIRDGSSTPATTAWWGPPAAMTASTLSTLATACVLAAFIGYGGALLTQTNAFAATLYDVDDRTLSIGLAVARLGVVIALVLSVIADRHGRRAFILRATLAHSAVVIITGAAPTFELYIAGHTTIRALDTAIGIALVVLVAETVPAANRAYAVAMVGVIGGLGIFAASMLIPVAASGRVGLLVVHLLAVATLPVLARSRRLLRESDRYVAHVGERAGVRELLTADHRRNLAKAGGAMFLGLMFLGPATELMNRYLDDQRDLSPGRITLFLLLSSMPFLPMTILGARSADLRGRKPVAVVCVTATAIAYTGVFLAAPPLIWALGPLAAAFAAPSFAAIGVYGTELFPTRLRASANTAVTILGVAGAITGLASTAVLTNHLSLGTSIAVLAVAPLLAVALVARTFPETARRELEHISADPADQPAPRPSPAPDPSTLLTAGQRSFSSRR